MAFYFKPWLPQTEETISVTATGKTQVAPDIAQITATIETKDQNLDQARRRNEAKVTKVISSLKDLGVEEKDIKTQYLSANPTYESTEIPVEEQVQIFPVPPKPTTNVFSTSLEITIKNFDITDEIIAALTENGATNLYGPSLTLSEEKLNSVKSKARENAIEDAKTKGQELANLSGRKLGRVTKVTEQGDFGYPVPILTYSEADLKQRASQIQPGQNEVTVNLQVEFSLK